MKTLFVLFVLALFNPTHPNYNQITADGKTPVIAFAEEAYESEAQCNGAAQEFKETVPEHVTLVETLCRPVTYNTNVSGL